MDAEGARFFAGGLESPRRAKSLRKQPGGNISIPDGPYLEAKEHIGGFWILQCADMDEALAWGRKDRRRLPGSRRGASVRQNPAG